MLQFSLSAFADEAAADIGGQIKALKENNIPYLEVRGVNGKNITELSIADARALKLRLASEGLKVWSIGSPIGKISIHDDFEKHLEVYKHTLEIGKELDAFCMRIFSFYMPKGEDPAQYKNEVMEKMNRFCEIAKDSDMILCHENEKGIYGDIADRCAEILFNCPDLKAVFDPANFIQCGQAIEPAWRLLGPHVKYLHIKDALPNGTVVPAGQGIGEVRKIIEAFYKNGGEVLSLEPHLASFEGLSKLEQDQKTKMGEMIYKDNRSAFDAAHDALIELLKND